MELKLYNTLTRRKEPFRPIDPARVRMYVCGPTVYDFAHIGNARPVIVFDLLYRLLREFYGADHVKYVRNITDVDDKINSRATERAIPIGELTKATYQWFRDDTAALRCLSPTHEPRATEYIDQMIRMIETLVSTGHAYPVEGHVLFDVSSKRDYGKLSNRSVDEMIAGARVEVAPYKKNPMDFVLWKPSPSELPGWHSPWGRGRPGWHIECSAMGESLLGETFDIHGGGVDLVFPHHENEIAQSESAHGGTPLARYWMHNGFLRVEGEKMAKSAGNFVTIHELLEQWTGSVVRYAMMQTHYTQPIDWTIEKLERSRAEMANWAGLYSGSEAHNDYQYRKHRKIEPKPSAEVIDALADDLNTPKAIAILREQFSSRNPANGLGKEFLQNCEFLGLVDPERIGLLQAESVSGSVAPRLLFDSIPIVLRLRAGMANARTDVIEQATRELSAVGISVRDLRDGFFELQPFTKEAEIDGQKIDSLLAKRAAARKAKDFNESDRIRDELAAMGVVLKDNKDGTTTWEVAR